jgi:hypothetical protein
VAASKPSLKDAAASSGAERSFFHQIPGLNGPRALDYKLGVLSNHANLGVGDMTSEAKRLRDRQRLLQLFSRNSAALHRTFLGS